MVVSIIVAKAQNNTIGAGNQLLWHISDDLKRFKAITTGHTIIMGRKTYQSIGRALPNRKNIVVTRDAEFVAPGCLVYGSFSDALSSCSAEDEVFIIGGGEIYQQALPLASRLYITQVHKSFDGDTYFPEFDADGWREVSRQEGSSIIDAHTVDYTFINYERI